MEIPGVLPGAGTWFNVPEPAAGELGGRVVLVDFWTYTCVNWLRTLPYRRAWHERYREHGLVVLGVHTPEFDFEHDAGNVRRAVAALGVRYPVVTDNAYAIWNAFANHYWPALYLLDPHGRIRHHRFGEGNYPESEAAVRQVLAEAGADLGSTPPVVVEPAGIEVAADLSGLGSPETYLGTDRASYAGLVPGKPHSYAAPSYLALNHWALAGQWTAGEQAVELHEAGGAITFRFHARDLNLVMAPGGDPVRFRVRLDARAPGTAAGLDVDEDGEGLVAVPGLHQLIRQPGPAGDRTFEITFLDPGVRAHVVTFG